MAGDVEDECGSGAALVGDVGAEKHVICKGFDEANLAFRPSAFSDCADELGIDVEDAGVAASVHAAGAIVEPFFAMADQTEHIDHIVCGMRLVVRWTVE